MSLLTDASLIVTPNGYNVNKLYSVIPNTTLGDMTVVRALSATRVNSAGFIEIARTNLVLRSEEFNLTWSPLSATVTANTTTAPDGNVTADTINLSATADSRVVQNYSIANSTTYTLSCFFKNIALTAGETFRLQYNNQVVAPNNFQMFATIDLAAGTATYSSVGTLVTGYSGTVTGVVEPYANGWYRISVTLTTGTLAAANGQVQIIQPIASQPRSFYAWGAQLEIGNVATEYIPTTTVARTKFAGIIQDGLYGANIPRIDYPPLGGCPRILVEPLITNNVLYSEQFDNDYWGKSLVTITPNAAVAPDNNTTADKFIPTNITNVHQIAKLGLVSNAYTFSVFAKAGEETTFSMWLRNSAVGAIFNLSNGTYTSSSPTPPTSANMEPYPNGWYRCSVYDATAGTDVRIYARNGGSFAGNNINGFFLWGAQAEIASTATSYIPTTINALARNADVISKTGISSLIGQTEGTLYAEFNNTLMTYAATGYVMRIFADANNEVWIRKESGTNKYTARWRANSVDVYTQSTISVLNGNNKIAIAYKSADSAVYLNGSQIGTSASTGAFSVAPSQIGIGSSSTDDFFNDRIELATLFKTRLTNAQLATLTSL